MGFFDALLSIVYSTPYCTISFFRAAYDGSVSPELKTFEDAEEPMELGKQQEENIAQSPTAW